MSLQPLTGCSGAAVKQNQCDGGFGRNSGEGGSWNLAPAYAFPSGDGDLEQVASAGLGGGETLNVDNIGLAKNGNSVPSTGLHLL